MLCMYNYVDKNYDVIIPYIHNTAHVIILPLEIIHYTIRLTYNTFNNHLLHESTFKVLFIINASGWITTVVQTLSRCYSSLLLF